MAYWTTDGFSSDADDAEQLLSVEKLVVLAQSGDQQAFETLYTRHIHQIKSYLSYKVGNDGVGCELTQDVFLKVWSALPKLTNPAVFVTWLYSIALNSARDYHKRHKHMQMIPLDVCSSEEAALSVEGPEEGIEEAELLQIALALVSPLHRACLTFYVIEGLSQQQIAARLGIKKTCVGTYVSRGKEELRQIYSRLLSGQSAVSAKGRKG